MWTISLAACLALAATANAAASQTEELVFPLAESPNAEANAQRLGAPLLEPDLAAIERLTGLEHVLLTDVPLPDGLSSTLDLERIDLARRRFGFQIDGVPAPAALDDLSLSVWKGTIAGDPLSDVYLGFSKYGCHGWIKSRDGLVHLLPSEVTKGHWLGAPAVFVLERDLAGQGFSSHGGCAALPSPVAPVPSLPASPPIATQQSGALRALHNVQMRECSIAMESDYQYHQNWNNASAQMAYMATLFTFISDRYEGQIETTLTFPYVQIYTTSNDPWSTPENGGTSIDMLNEFRTAWAGAVPMNARLGHMISGADLGGGVAYLDTLCSTSFNFGVSGNATGSVGFPIVQQPSNWDFYIIGHEVGHNFNGQHTHEFCPPLDECANMMTFGPCQTNRTCSNSGTMMSYCHTCSGGTANITTYFHPENVARMAEASINCNPLGFEVLVDAPTVVSDTSPTAVLLTELVGDVTDANILYRPLGGLNWSFAPMAEQGAVWIGSLPPWACGTRMEYTLLFEVDGVGTFAAPSDAPVNVYEAIGGMETTLFADDFESATGWQAANLGATSGDWVREVPINDTTWAYDPMSDADGSGSCYLTENQPGNSDVDDGSVQLTSPLFDLSGPGARVEYAYYLRLTDADGTDRILVEARSNGGPWREVTRHDTDGGLAWRAAFLSAAQFDAAGVNPSPTTQMRFTVNDGNPQSIIEAGLDAFSVSQIDCIEIGTSDCGPAVMNSRGLSAAIRAEGSVQTSANTVRLLVNDVPLATFGLLILSRDQGSVPNLGGGVGTLCLGGSIGRDYTNILNSAGSGRFLTQLDLTRLPQPTGNVAVLPGQTWHFQAWYRDTLAGVPVSNLSDAVSVSFQ